MLQQRHRIWTKYKKRGLRPCKEPEDIVKGGQSFGLLAICEALIESPKWSLFITFQGIDQMEAVCFRES
ncbi:MAG: hypothetical protein BAW33_04395 [Desulfobacterales bacterium C00003104]|nr:MAG: hypothetical protein BAW33_04395 [Desulfobacterales bacterium C00003104]